jgi:hypothetical protein
MYGRRTRNYSVDAGFGWGQPLGDDDSAAS